MHPAHAHGDPGEQHHGNTAVEGAAALAAVPEVPASMNSHEWLLPPGIQEETQWFDPPRMFADQVADILDDAHRQIVAAFAIPVGNIAPPPGAGDRVVFGRGEMAFVLGRRTWEAMTPRARIGIGLSFGEPRGG